MTFTRGQLETYWQAGQSWHLGSTCEIQSTVRIWCFPQHGKFSWAIPSENKSEHFVVTVGKHHTRAKRELTQIAILVSITHSFFGTSLSKAVFHSRPGTVSSWVFSLWFQPKNKHSSGFYVTAIDADIVHFPKSGDSRYHRRSSLGMKMWKINRHSSKQPNRLLWYYSTVFEHVPKQSKLRVLSYLSYLVHLIKPWSVSSDSPVSLGGGRAHLNSDQTTELCSTWKHGSQFT